MTPVTTAPAYYPPIGDYAIIGNCRSAALVSREGSLDWLCWPRFDSPSIFAALLDAGQGGRFSVRPCGAFRTERRYVPETNVLETLFHGPEGSVALRDLMPIVTEDSVPETLTAEHEILRQLEGLSGESDVEIHYEPRPDYARQGAVLQQRGAFGIWSRAGRGVLVLLSEAPLHIAADKRSAGSTVRMSAGELRYLSLTYSEGGPAVIPALGTAARDRLAGSVRWWQAWAGRCAYQGPYRDCVVRNVLALKLMCFSPSGAVVAAPTTSLPEEIGGDQNWDYRYCWLRDASFTVRALGELGYQEEAAAYCGWLLHATRLSWPRLQVLYDVYGETRLPEHTLSYLPGYAGSRPVHIGNGAYGQRQLDVYGEVIDAVSRMARKRDFFKADTVRFLNGLGRTVCDQWREPDAGIWESRAQPQHYTHSKILCWVALDRLIALHDAFDLRLDADRFRREREAIRSTVEQHGYNERLGSYTQTFDSDALDASLLTLPWYGYIDAADPRMVGTYNRIMERLGHGALVYRHAGERGRRFPPAKGAFGVCGFWAVDCQARRGETRLAAKAFEELIGYGNDLGLFAEEIDAQSGAALGNFPQAFTHVGVINAALTLAGNEGTPEQGVGAI